MELWLSPAVGLLWKYESHHLWRRKEQRFLIAIKEVASFAVASIGILAARNRAVELGGPEALSPIEEVDILEKSKGNKIELQFVP